MANTTRVEVSPKMLRWARERAGLGIDTLSERFPKFKDWEKGQILPTLKQLERFAKVTYTPIGYLFLQEPPVESIPIPDFRTVENVRVGHPSPDLLDTLYLCQQRQEWYREFARSMGEKPQAYVGSARAMGDVESTAATIREKLRFDLEERRQIPTWTDALRRFIALADDVGILVMCSGVVLNNNYRHLDPNEFRGFAIADDLAPLVFINGADTKAAQMFTLAHELAHIWLGQSAVSDAQASWVPDHQVERWCNQVAAEMLVPLDVLRNEYSASIALQDSDLQNQIGHFARRFKVSTLVILRRLHDAGWLSREQLQKAYTDELQRLRELTKASGGDFYLTLGARASKRFTRALVVSTFEGRTSFTEAFRLLGFKKMATFRDLGKSLGIGV